MDINEELKGANHILTKRVNELEHKYWEVVEKKKQQEREMTSNIQTMQNALLSKQKEMEDFQLNHLNDGNLEFEKVRIQNKLELAYASELEEKDKQIEDMRDQLDSLEKENRILGARVANSLSDQQSTLESLKSSHSTQIDSLMKEIAELQERLAFGKSEEELRETRIAKDALEDKTRHLQKQLDEALSELDTISSERNSSNVDRLRGEERLREELNNMIVEKDRLEVQNSLLTTENHDLISGIKEVEKNYYSVLREKNELEKSIQIKQHDMDELEERNFVATEKYGRELVEREEEYSRKERQFQTKITDLESEIRQIEIQNKNLKSATSSKMTDMTNELSRLEMELSSLRKENHGLKETVEREKQTISSHQKIIEQVTNDKERIIQDYKMLESKFQFEKTENQELNEYITKKKTEDRIRKLHGDEDGSETNKPSTQVPINGDRPKKDTDVNQKSSKNSLEAEAQKQIQHLKKENFKLKTGLKELSKKLVKAVQDKVLLAARLGSLDMNDSENGQKGMNDARSDSQGQFNPYQGYPNNASQQQMPFPPPQYPQNMGGIDNQMYHGQNRFPQGSVDPMAFQRELEQKYGPLAPIHEQYEYGLPAASNTYTEGFSSTGNCIYEPGFTGFGTDGFDRTSRTEMYNPQRRARSPCVEEDADEIQHRAMARTYNERIPTFNPNSGMSSAFEVTQRDDPLFYRPRAEEPVLYRSLQIGMHEPRGV